MKQAIKLLMILLLFFSSLNVWGQTPTAMISFKLFYPKSVLSEIIINGQLLKPDDKKHVIKINPTGFDTLVSVRNDQLKTTTVLKFRANTEYLMRVVPCSMYDIKPIKTYKNGVVRYYVTPYSKNIVEAQLDYASKEIMVGKWTSYYAYLPSAMCPYVRRKIALMNPKTSKKMCEVYFHFLHGEKLSLVYNPNTRTYQLKVDGYLKKGETYPTMY